MGVSTSLTEFLTYRARSLYLSAELSFQVPNERDTADFSSGNGTEGWSQTETVN